MVPSTVMLTTLALDLIQSNVQFRIIPEIYKLPQNKKRPF
jgi:hypothetical protein